MFKTTNTSRWHLLTTVSAVALLGSVGSAVAGDETRPVLWIEMGGQFDQLSDKQEAYAPPFVSNVLANPFKSPIALQAPPRFSMGEEARISFQPEESDWIFSAGLRYGRANRSGNSHEETSPTAPKIIVSNPAYNKYATVPLPVDARRFATTDSQIHQSNTILDFQVGRDVGLGMFGGSSIVNLGVRFAQFNSRSTVRIDADPDFHITNKYITSFGGHPVYIKIPIQHWDLYVGKMSASRSFRGVGPSLEWEGNSMLAGNPEAGAITFDWGLNGAILFGKQKMRAHEQATAYQGAPGSRPLPVSYRTAHDPVRSRSVTVPNIGGFAGLSLRYPNVKLSLGYRADFFFGAVDGGLDTRKSEDRGFYGPFASISVGLGD